MTENPFAEKTYVVGEKTYTLRPLSFFELLDFPELVMKLVEALPAGKETNPVEIAAAAKEEIKGVLARCLGIEPGELKQIPSATGMEMLADFLDMNLNENFFKALRRTVAAGKSIYSSSFRSSSPTGTGSR